MYEYCRLCWCLETVWTTVRPWFIKTVIFLNHCTNWFWLGRTKNLRARLGRKVRPGWHLKLKAIKTCKLSVIYQFIKEKVWEKKQNEVKCRLLSVIYTELNLYYHYDYYLKYNIIPVNTKSFISCNSMKTSTDSGVLWFFIGLKEVTYEMLFSRSFNFLNIKFWGLTSIERRIQIYDKRKSSLNWASYAVYEY